ncbi:uncharacterized protein LOC134189192 [Corticium candelabrum]|uniref:uncharacterized protein LOC134189192 n=1 Tax=Corticium candelabrum TaxID=121492 RepID=UPI002E267D49|nr:uncharacterized protein LOC134189192 [Corticium candelabrum]
MVRALTALQNSSEDFVLMNIPPMSNGITSMNSVVAMAIGTLKVARVCGEIKELGIICARVGLSARKQITFCAPLGGQEASHCQQELLRLIDRLGPSNQSGLTKKEIDRLPCKKLMKADDLSNTDQRNCVICLTDFKKGQNLRVLPCSHRFHKPCIDKWLKVILLIRER